MNLEKDFPNFIFKNINAFVDMGCIIKDELPVIAPNQRVELIKTPGRHGTLHKTYGDYESFNLPVQNVSIPYDRLEDVKAWLRGSGPLITHNDEDKYYQAYVRHSAPMEFTNEIGVFYNFNILFECQPLKKKINEPEIKLKQGGTPIFNPGTEISYPYFEIDSNGGDIQMVIDNETFTLLETKQGLITVDCEKGLVILDGSRVKSRGRYPSLKPNQMNTITLNGNFSEAKIWQRSVWS